MLFLFEDSGMSSVIYINISFLRKKIVSFSVQLEILLFQYKDL